MVFWLHEKPEPHANGLRFLATSGSTKDIQALRKWSNPSIPLPKEGQQPPLPREWEIAQSAMRYVGWLKDPQSWGVLEKGLTRRDKKIDATMDSLMGGGLAILGMTLRALNVGAADGFAQWGDPKAFPLLVKFIEDDARERAGATRSLLRAPLGGHRRAHERHRQEGAPVQRQRAQEAADPRAATSKPWCTARSPAPARAWSI